MASDNRASYAKIGFTVSLGVFAIVATLIYLGGLRGRGDVVLVETYYDKPVTGLTVGSVVNFRGVKIGEVREIAMLGNRYDVDEQNMTRIYILMAIDVDRLNPKVTVGTVEEKLRRYVARRGMRASVKSNAVTGLSRVEIDFYPEEDPKSLPVIAWSPKHLYMPSKESLMDGLAVAATKVMNQINRMDLNTFWSNLNASVEQVSQCAETANVLMQSRRTEIERILDNLAATSDSLRELSAELRQDPSALVRGVDRPTLNETVR